MDDDDDEGDNEGDDEENNEKDDNARDPDHTRRCSAAAGLGQSQSPDSAEFLSFRRARWMDARNAYPYLVAQWVTASLPNEGF